MRPQFRILMVLLVIFTFTSASYANIKTYRVKWGETLYSLLSDKFSPQEILSINKELKKLVPDFILKKGTLVKESESSITFMPNFLTDIAIKKVNDDFELDVVKYPVSTVTSVVEGEISSSLTDIHVFHQGIATAGFIQLLARDNLTMVLTMPHQQVHLFMQQQMVV